MSMGLNPLPSVTARTATTTIHHSSPMSLLVLLAYQCHHLVTARTTTAIHHTLSQTTLIVLWLYQHNLATTS